MNDLISRQQAIDEISRWLGYLDDDMILRIQIGLRKLPSAQPEPSIPLSWIEEQIERLNNMDNYFATLTANIIKTMLNEWRKGEPNANN